VASAALTRVVYAWCRRQRAVIARIRERCMRMPIALSNCILLQKVASSADDRVCFVVQSNAFEAQWPRLHIELDRCSSVSPAFNMAVYVVIQP
jgi:hypothetical protein